MNKWIILMMVFVVLLSSCTDKEATEEIEKSEQKTAEEKQVVVKAEPSSATVAIINNQFVPATLTVKPGTEVVWVNKDAISHLIISDGDEMFDSTTLDREKSHSYVFENSGEYKYHDGFKPLVKGSIIVK